RSSSFDVSPYHHQNGSTSSSSSTTSPVAFRPNNPQKLFQQSGFRITAESSSQSESTEKSGITYYCKLCHNAKSRHKSYIRQHLRTDHLDLPRTMAAMRTAYPDPEDLREKNEEVEILVGEEEGE